MDEKIKISAPKEVLELLKKDCEDFRVFKKDGTPNFNAFLNAVVANFYEQFGGTEEELRDEVKNALQAVPERYREAAFLNVLKIFAKRQVSGAGKESKVFAFKPTKGTEKAIIYIKNTLPQDQSLSSYFMRLFTTYSKKTKTEREKIVYNENYTLITKAIKKGVTVCMTFAGGGIVKSASVYSVCAARDELFNYVLFYNGKQNVTVRLASIDTVLLLAEKGNIPADNAELFRRQQECAPQYTMYSTDIEPIKVRLTAKGEGLFKKIYLYRPSPVAVEGDIYTFDCSANQLLYYFERFGDSALILSPKKLGIFMRNYYYFAYKKYKTLYGRD